LDDVFRRYTDANERVGAARDWYADQWQHPAWTALKTEFNLRALRQRPLRKRVNAIWRHELDAYAGLIAQYFAEAGMKPSEDPQTIALALLAMAQGLGMLSLLNADEAFESRLAESRKMAFDRLIPKPQAPARRAARVRTAKR
ncbi:MAG TPA: hypothetical protein VMU19_14625, partial [Bryobacteraceae bacterium]|nr:hypothetical protein [Bryobacteraceae bacterium]